MKLVKLTIPGVGSNKDMEIFVNSMLIANMQSDTTYTNCNSMVEMSNGSTYFCKEFAIDIANFVNN